MILFPLSIMIYIAVSHMNILWSILQFKIFVKCSVYFVQLLKRVRVREIFQARNVSQLFTRFINLFMFILRSRIPKCFLNRAIFGLLTYIIISRLSLKLARTGRKPVYHNQLKNFLLAQCLEIAMMSSTQIFSFLKAFLCFTLWILEHATQFFSWLLILVYVTLKERFIYIEYLSFGIPSKFFFILYSRSMSLKTVLLSMTYSFKCFYTSDTMRASPSRSTEFLEIFLYVWKILVPIWTITYWFRISPLFSKFCAVTTCLYDMNFQKITLILRAELYNRLASLKVFWKLITVSPSSVKIDAHSKFKEHLIQVSLREQYGECFH